MKYTSYKQIKEATAEKLCAIDPDDYTDEAHLQIIKWITEAAQELIPEDKLLKLTDAEKASLGLLFREDDERIVMESMDEHLLNGKKIVGKVVLDYPEFSIIMENGTGNLHRLMKNEND